MEAQNTSQSQAMVVVFLLLPMFRASITYNFDVKSLYINSEANMICDMQVRSYLSFCETFEDQIGPYSCDSEQACLYMPFLVRRLLVDKKLFEWAQQPFRRSGLPHYRLCKP